MKRDNIATAAIPIRMGQAGSIRLTQIAAYDKDGNVLPVKFHVSLYYVNSVAVDSMPQFPVLRGASTFPDYLKPRKTDAKGGATIPTTYGKTVLADKNQTHPFYKGGFEKVQPDGSNYPWGGDVQLADESQVVGWGNYYEPAGYSPGRFSKGAARTGMLEDTTPWTWDLTSPGNLNLDQPADNAKEEYAGMSVRHDLLR